MNVSAISNAMTRFVGRASLRVSKYAPEILTGAGVVGVVATTVMASKATLKAPAILRDLEANLDTIEEVQRRLGNDPNGEYSPDEAKMDQYRAYAIAGKEFVKLYAPSFALGVVSILAIVGSTRILRGRNLALAAAYKLLDESFKKYRSRVIEEFGEDGKKKDLEFRFGPDVVEERVKIDEDGNREIVTTHHKRPDEFSMYAKAFNEDSTQYDHKSVDYNIMFIRSVQAQMNDKLKAQGHLFLNEVYDALGLPRTRPGAVVGWLYDYDPTKLDGRDCYVDFGLNDPTNEQAMDFLNGYNKTVILDFNVDGPIHELI